MDIYGDNGGTPSECGPSVDLHYLYQELYIPAQVVRPDDLQDSLGEEELMSFASKYLNLDYEPPISVNHDTISAVAGSTSTSQSATNITEDGVACETQPQPTLSLDAAKFGAGVDANSAATRDPRRRGDHGDQRCSPLRHFDERNDAQKYESARIKAKLRIGLAERVARDAPSNVKEVKSTRRGGEEKAKGVEMEGSVPIIAFSRVIRGRTIYNP